MLKNISFFLIFFSVQIIPQPIKVDLSNSQDLITFDLVKEALVKEKNKSDLPVEIELDLSHNAENLEIFSFEEAAELAFYHIVELNLSYNNLSEDQICWISMLQGLKWLYLAYNDFEVIPKCLCDLDELELLSLASNKIKILEVENIPYFLKSLYLSDNCLTCLPDNIASLQIKHLFLDGNLLSSEELARLNGIRYLKELSFTPLFEQEGEEAIPNDLTYIFSLKNLCIVLKRFNIRYLRECFVLESLKKNGVDVEIIRMLQL